MTTKYLSKTIGYLILLSDAYAREGRFKEAKNVEKLIKYLENK